MDRRRAPSLALFAGASLALHGAAFGVLGRAARDAPRFDPATETVAGETLDVDPETRDPADPGDDDRPAEPAAAPARAPAPLAAGAPAGHAGGAPSAAAANRPALFGAVGVRFATDLATTFTRAFPQAASADPVWSRVAFGAAGAADVVLVLDDEGRIASSSILGAPSAALRRGIDRTLALLMPRAFTAHAPIVKLRVAAHVSRDDVHDGLHGDVFALSGGSFTGDVGTAFFALPAAEGTGRRVDVELKLLP